MNDSQEEHKGANRHAHAEDAQKRMLTAVPTATSDERVAAVRKRVIDPRKRWDSVNYIYVTDKRGTLKGVASIKELLRTGGRRKMREFHRKDLVSIHRHSPLRLAAVRAITHNIKAVPVVDRQRRFLGIVGADALMDILEREHVRDLLTASGVPAGKSRFADVLTARLRDMIRWRTPWLLIGIAGGMLTAGIVERFEGNLEQILELAFFIPVILYMGAAVGTQTQMLYIRGASYQQIDLKRYLWKELVIDVFIGIILASIMGTFAALSTGSSLLGWIIASAIFVIVSTAGFVAISISWLFIRLRQDPAIGGGPFATIAQDVVSIFLYMLVASLFLL